MPIRENRISEEELETLNNLRRTLESSQIEDEVENSTELREEVLERETSGEQGNLSSFTYTEESDTPIHYENRNERVWKNYDTFFEKKCNFIEIKSEEVLNCQEPQFVNGTHLKWKCLTVDFKKSATPKIIQYKDEKDFDYIIDVYQNKEFLYRWVISCESIYEIDFSSEEFVRVYVNPKDCVIIK